MNTFLSAVAVLLSTLALVCSGYTAYQVFTLQQTLNTTKTAINPVPIPAPSSTAPTSPEPTPLSPASTPAAATTSVFQPGQFVQPAFGNKAKVELLSLQRIKDPLK